MRWPIREALLALHARRQAEAVEQYRFDMALWTLAKVMGGTKSAAPKVPSILKG